jgi:uncharacterized protein YjbI with pentapeptide repeats
MTDTVQIDEGIKIAQVPQTPVEDPKLRPVIDSVRNVLATRAFGKDKLERWVTWRDLVSNNIVVYQNGNQSVVGSSNVFFPVGSDGTDFTSPPTPTGFAVTSAVYSIILEWNDPAYNNYAYTEIWRSATNNLGTAVLLGTTQAFQYADMVGLASATYYYWIRFVSKTNVTGAYNSTTGTGASTGKVGNADLTDLIITSQKLAAEAVTSNAIATGAVQTVNIADTAITAAKIQNLAVGNAAIANLAVTTGKIADLAVDSAKIANASIVNAKIADASISTAKIQDAAINNAKIGAAAIQTANIQDGAITNAKIQDASITNAKIGDTIQSNDFSSGSTGWRIQKSGAMEMNNATFRGTIDVRSAGSGARLEIRNNVIKVIDGNGIVRAKIGDLTA